MDATDPIVEKRATQAFQAARPLGLADDARPAPRCACARCEEADAKDAALARVDVRQVTTVITYRPGAPDPDPTVKAYATTGAGRIGVGNGHSEILAVMDAVRQLETTR